MWHVHVPDTITCFVRFKQVKNPTVAGSPELWFRLAATGPQSSGLGYGERVKAGRGSRGGGEIRVGARCRPGELIRDGLSA